MITDQIPSNFNPQLEVVSCYIVHDGKILMLQRHPEHKHSSQWGLPAGKLERGETLEQGVLRETKEETGISLDSKKLSFFETVLVSHKDKEFLYHSFHTSFSESPNIELNPPEHKHFDWFTFEQMMSLDLIHDLDTIFQRHYRDVLQPAGVK